MSVSVHVPCLVRVLRVSRVCVRRGVLVLAAVAGRVLPSVAQPPQHPGHAVCGKVLLVPARQPHRCDGGGGRPDTHAAAAAGV